MDRKDRLVSLMSPQQPGTTQESWHLQLAVGWHLQLSALLRSTQGVNTALLHFPEQTTLLENCWFPSGAPQTAQNSWEGSIGHSDPELRNTD